MHDQQKFNVGVTKPSTTNDISDIFNSSNLNRKNTNNSTSREFLNFEEQPLHKSKMTLAEKKKLQWQQEKGKPFSNN